MNTMLLKAKYVRIILLILSGGILAYGAGLAVDVLIYPGGGIGQRSPDGNYLLLINGTGRYVNIMIVGPEDNEKKLVTYKHDADGMYLRQSGNSITWSNDSQQASAKYHDILNGETVLMEFHYDRGAACWSLNKRAATKEENNENRQGLELK